MKSDAQLVDYGLVFYQTKHPRLWVSFLGLWGNRANLDKSKSGPVKALHGFTMLVKPSSNPNRVWEFHAKQVGCLDIIKEFSW